LQGEKDRLAKAQSTQRKHLKKNGRKAPREIWFSFCVLGGTLRLCEILIFFATCENSNKSKSIN
jgi:hypothetical protein